MFKEMLEFKQVVLMLQEAKDIKFAILSPEGPSVDHFLNYHYMFQSCGGCTSCLMP
jgi:hypothetical protein